MEEETQSIYTGSDTEFVLPPKGYATRETYRNSESPEITKKKIVPSGRGVTRPIYMYIHPFEPNPLAGDAVRNDDDQKSEKGIFAFEVIEMFSPEVKRFFEHNINKKTGLAFKISDLNTLIDRMLHWDSIPAPLHGNFWGKLSKEIGNSLINEKGISLIEHAIAKRLAESDLKMETFNEMNYGKRSYL